MPSNRSEPILMDANGMTLRIDPPPKNCPSCYLTLHIMERPVFDGELEKTPARYTMISLDPDQAKALANIIHAHLVMPLVT